MKKLSMKVLALVALLALSSQAAATVVHTGTTLTTSATLIDTTPTHIYIKVWNNCGQTAYVGFSSGITAVTGIPVPAQTWIEFNSDIAPGLRLYGIVSATTCDVRTLEVKQ